MARKPIQRHAFNAGEIAPDLHWRSDLDRYHLACKTLENFIIRPQGQAMRRPGTRYKARLGDDGDFASETMRLIPFRFDVDTYFAVLLAVDFGDTTATIRVFNPDGTTAATITSASYTASELKDIQFAQINDVLFLAHQNHPLARLERQAGPTWVLVDHVFGGGPYQEQNSDPDAELSLWVENWHPQKAYAVGDYVIDASARRPTLVSPTCNTRSLSAVSSTDVRRVSSGVQYVAIEIRSTSPTTFNGISVGDVVQLRQATPTNVDGYHRVAFKEADATYGYLYLDSDLTTAGVGFLISTNQFVSGCAPLTSVTQSYRCITGIAAGAGTAPGTPAAEWTTDSLYKGDVLAYPLDDIVVFDGDAVGAKFRVLNQDGASFSGRFRYSGGNIQLKQELDGDGTTGSGTFTTTTTTDAVPAFGRLTFRVTDAESGSPWKGELVLEASDDDGLHWYTLSSIRSEGAGTSNREVVRDVVKTGTVVRVRAVEINGTNLVEFYVDVAGPLYAHTTFAEEVHLDGYLGRLTLDTAVRRLDDTYQWAFGSFNERDGYPRSVAVHEERLMLAGTAAEPTTVWGSRINEFEEWQEGTLETSPVAFTIASDTFSAIQWIISKQDLIIGTAETEWALGSRSTTEALSPTTVSARQYSAHGSLGIQAILSGDRVLFVERGGIKVRGLVYSFDTDSYVAEDLNAFARHIAGGSALVETALQKAPDNHLWCLRADGTLASFTWEPIQQVLGWTRHEFGDGVRSVCVTPGTGTSDTLWLVVDRGGELYLETLALDDTVYLDCAVVATHGTRVATVTLPQNLAGYVLIAQDAELTVGAGNDYTVSGTTATIDADLTFLSVIAGVRYTSTLETTDHVVEEFAHSGKVRGVSADLYVSGTLGGDLSLDGGTTTQPLDIGDGNEFDYVGDNGISYPAALFTGRVEVPIRSGYRDQVSLWYETDAHWPANINAIAVEARRYE